jgi:hypothetical protein
MPTRFLCTRRRRPTRFFEFKLFELGRFGDMAKIRPSLSDKWRQNTIEKKEKEKCKKIIHTGGSNTDNNFAKDNDKDIHIVGGKQHRRPRRGARGA